MNPKISIIVPVYKVEQYLPRCIDSILAQTFTDFELLLIDDGSPDRSGEICDEYALKDSRIRVFHKENGGVSSARNMGLDNAKGEWIAFVDSDDVVTSAYLMDMFNAIGSNTQFVLSNYCSFNIDSSVAVLKDVFLEKEEIVRYFIENKIFVLSAPYSKLYNLDIIRRYLLRFPIGIHMGEDAIFIMKYLNKIERVNIVNKCNYTVCLITDSLSSKYYSFGSEWKCYVIWRNEMLTFLTRFGNVYENPLEIAWENRIGDTFNRCILCLFRQNRKTSFIEKLNCLKSIPISTINEYSMFYNPTRFKNRIIKYLMVNRLYVLLLLIGKLDRYK